MPLPLPQDRWLWLGLGVFTVFAAYTAWRLPVEVTKPRKAPEKAAKQGVWEVTQETEDALSEEALFTLVKSSTGQEIRQSATKILLDRFMQSEAALNSFKADLGSKKAEIREKAVSLVRYILKHSDITSRRNLLHDKEIQRLLSSMPTSTLRSSANIDYEMPIPGSLTRTLTGTPGSLDPPVFDSNSQLQPRTRENLSRLGEGEQEARRRRREAVVVNEGDHPLDQGDIIQRAFGAFEEVEGVVGVAGMVWGDDNEVEEEAAGGDGVGVGRLRGRSGLRNEVFAD